ncbi:hypothetical protein [Micromonospora aurantiaca (nom. illeg.)]|uniref:YCII-related domain-containing protein n=1 Tax=Micromonospora aurantiaca (nom. illeg.) TaxID=47850 RepID=A0A6N3JUW9_9ACTN|nr:hypothetical protein [Micromonospora aurantiaca]AXH88813.1 hypothetical protein DVH21_02090 [Micromonospora aurantiaca]KAB1111983.1 hypothetical protein F6X54_16035 [Micromonospora aurantiaca]
MPLFAVKLTLWVTPPGDASLPAFIDRLRAHLVALHEAGCITAPTATGHFDTHTCQITLSVDTQDITAAPLAAGRAVCHAADQAAPHWRVEVGRITAEPAAIGPTLPPEQTQ